MLARTGYLQTVSMWTIAIRIRANSCLL